jgi:hypothetical protein
MYLEATEGKTTHHPRDRILPSALDKAKEANQPRSSDRWLAAAPVDWLQPTTLKTFGCATIGIS